VRSCRALSRKRSSSSARRTVVAGSAFVMIPLWRPGDVPWSDGMATYGQGFIVGHGMGAFPGSWQQTDTHWVAPTPMVTVAVDVSLVPLPTSVPLAAPPSFSFTPNHGSEPIWKLPLAGVATIVATLPGVTGAVTIAPVDAAPSLTATEHQLRKFITVSVGTPELVAGFGVVAP
jgi:hypothetical protein